MLKQNPLESNNVIEPMKVTLTKEDLEKPESMLKWGPITKFILVILVLVSSSYILFKIVN